MDDATYVNDSNNFSILSAESIYKINPVIFELFEAPYGTDLCWLYEGNTLTGFYDLKTNEDTTIEKILKLL